MVQVRDSQLAHTWLSPLHHVLSATLGEHGSRTEPGVRARRILVVDDEPSIVDAVTTALRYGGLDVWSALPR